MDNSQLTVSDLLKFSYKAGDSITEADKEMLPVFTQEGLQIGVAPRFLCHRLGLIHKVVYLIIRNSKGEMLLQIRGNDGRFDVPVGGHVSAEDASDKESLIRETYEEIGICLEENKIIYNQTYFRDAEPSTNKQYQVNRELRVLYSYTMDEKDEEMLNLRFLCREEKKEVAKIVWVDLDTAIKYCDLSLSADGLKSSLFHYLKLLLNANTVSHLKCEQFNYSL